MDAVKFLEELKRMCENIGDCGNCPAHFQRSGFFACKLEHIPESYEDFAFDDLVSFVEKWSAEHPVKTRLQDFMEKHPNAMVKRNGLPPFMPTWLGYCSKSCHSCERQPTDKECWDLPLEE